MDGKVSANAREVKCAPQHLQVADPDWSLRRRLRRAGRRNAAYKNGNHTRRRQFVQAEVKDLMPKVTRVPEQLRTLPDTLARDRALRWWGELRALPGPEAWLEVDRKGGLYLRKAVLRLAWKWRQLAVRLVRTIRKIQQALGRAFRPAAAGTSTTDGTGYGAAAVAVASPSRASVRSQEVEAASEAARGNTWSGSCANSPREPLAAPATGIIKPDQSEDPNDAADRKRFYADHLRPTDLLDLYRRSVPWGESPVLSRLAGRRALRRLREFPDPEFWRRAFAHIARSATLLGLAEHEELGEDFTLYFHFVVSRTYLPGCDVADDKGLVTVAEALEASYFDTEPAELVALARREGLLEDLRELWAAADDAALDSLDPAAPA